MFYKYSKPCCVDNKKEAAVIIRETLWYAIAIKPTNANTPITQPFACRPVDDRVSGVPPKYKKLNKN